jgi:prolyl-tRNA synthetase
MLAIPVTKGKKSPSERFAGADETFTIEALMQNGWALQSGTSHFLGQNFAKAFDVLYQSETGERFFVWATSWGVSTRLLGAMVMTHSDDKGLVLPPRVAPIQVIIVPITKGEGPEHEAVMAKVSEISVILKQGKIRSKVDDRRNMRPGAKYFDWERKGVPLRIEIGPRDITQSAAMLAFRNTGDKKQMSIHPDELLATINESLLTMNQQLFDAATIRTASKTFTVSSYVEMKQMVEKAGESAGFYLVPWKCDANNEAFIKEDCKATIRCYPLDANIKPPVGKKCFYSGEDATHMAIFARAF